MAPSKDSGRNKREADYSNIGVAGRKTGITLKDTGIRDENGLEPLEGIFSSPKKSPMKRNGVSHNSTIEEEEDMDIGQSTIPEPTEILSTRRGGKTILPPPKSRSPIKTTLNSSPRRSIGPVSSPIRRSIETPTTRAASHPLVNRKLDFSMEKTRRSLERSAQKPQPDTLSSVRGPKNTRSNKLLSVATKGRKKAFDLSLTEDEEEEEQEDETTENLEDVTRNDNSIFDDLAIPLETSVTDDPSAGYSNADGIPQLYEDESLQMNGRETLAVEDDFHEGVNGHIEDSSKPSKSKRGRPLKNASAATVSKTKLTKEGTQGAPILKKAPRAVKAASTAKEVVDEPHSSSEAEGQHSHSLAPAPPVAKISRGRAKAGPIPEEKQLAQETPRTLKRKERAPSSTIDESQMTQEVVKSKAGRPKNAQLEVFRDEDDEVQSKSSKPAKRRKTTPTIGERRVAKPPPSERGPNARIISTKKTKSKAPSADDRNLMPIRNKPGGRSLYVSRTETPLEDSGARVMKSGRTSVKPVAFWRNERIVYGERYLDGENVLLPGIKEVIRTDEIIEPRPKRPPGKRRGVSSKRHPIEDIQEKEEEEEQEDWEQDPGILPADVVQWNPQHRRGDPEDIEEIELAYAPFALQSNTREVRGANFRYAKILTLPFFGSGMVDIPPGGEKRVKNARKMQMVFFVFTGRVAVDVAGTQFSIGRGGMWQVPRGNFYAIANHTANPARIFFAQGCDVSEFDQALDINQGVEGKDT